MELEKLMTQIHKNIDGEEFDENIDTDGKCPSCGYEW